ncbi:unnamed protein product [Didymodactylos carnosus]|uniref:Transmembrane protein n=1 Tax=Didymodactylos carnosus TaxID=1234261 RepID=A0A814EWP6_9BILA|nr:unnamed protein product [Didymodactylos carnosus]CAF0972927.1 unnamed protein product [Didymodactylos carnosus]CAF3570215.1 unnamed protein product [Didymodactylos carnosus]CAF3745860.1 unnamed protein product [Didymodactylos carnosus]
MNICLVNDKPIKLLLGIESLCNIGFIWYVFNYSEGFLRALLPPIVENFEITPLAEHFLLWWMSSIFTLTCLMLAAIPSKYSTNTLTVGLIHVRRFIYWSLFGSEILCSGLLIYLMQYFAEEHWTLFGYALLLIFTILPLWRLFVLFIKNSWFGHIENMDETKTDKLKNN